MKEPILELCCDRIFVHHDRIAMINYFTANDTLSHVLDYILYYLTFRR
jgi:hypothetical protein